MIFSKPSDISIATFFGRWANWDGGHFINIAKNGYVNSQDLVFAPLYPTLIRVVNKLFKNEVISALALASSFFILYILSLQKFLKKYYSNEVVFCSIITFILFPTTFFAISAYSESLFLLLLILFFYFLKRENYFTASILATFAIFTRFIGIFLLVPLVYYYFAKINFNLKKINKNLIILLIPTLALTLFTINLRAKGIDLATYPYYQQSWGRFFVDPVSSIFSYLWPIITFEGITLAQFMDLFVTVLFLSVLIFNATKLPTSIWIFSMLTILIPASTGTLTSMPRFALSALGFFIIAGNFLANKRRLRLVFWSFLLTLQVILASLFINDFWVA